MPCLPLSIRSKKLRIASSESNADPREPSPTSSRTSFLPYTRAKHHHFDHSLLRILPCRTHMPSILSHRISAYQTSEFQHVLTSAYQPVDLIINKTLRITKPILLWPVTPVQHFYSHHVRDHTPTSEASPSMDCYMTTSNLSICSGSICERTPSLPTSSRPRLRAPVEHVVWA